jgi:hypothetical protein
MLDGFRSLHAAFASAQGSFAAGSYSLSSVALTQSGTDSYSQNATDKSSQQGQETRVLTGSYGGQYTVAYGGGNALGGTLAFGDTVTLTMSANGVETANSSNNATLTGGDSWSLTMLGSYGGYSYSFGTVIDQGVQSQQEKRGRESFSSPENPATANRENDSRPLFPSLYMVRLLVSVHGRDPR